jgi:hypothetical protein
VLRVVALTVLLLSPWALGQARAGGQDGNARIMLGVMRSDGILLPFASFDGDDWSAPWPAVVPGHWRPTGLPAQLAAIPADWWGGKPPSEWRLWSSDGGSGQGFKLVAPVVLLLGVERRLAIRTDFRPAAATPVPPHELPYPKEGLAVGGGAGVQPILSVSLNVPAGQKFLERLRPAIDEAEERAVRSLRSNARWVHPLNRSARAKVVPRLEAWYTTALTEPGASVSYVEAVKKYPPRPEDEGCGLETFVSGWIHQGGRDVRLDPELKAAVTYCDRETASYMLPLGQLQLRNRTHWVFQMSGQAHEWYAVAELTPGRTLYRVEYYAGGAPRGSRPR